MSWLGSVTGRLYRGEVSFDFVGRKKLWYAISGLILLISILALLVRGLDYSVDFKGGAVYTFPAAPAATSSATVSSVVTSAGGGSGVIAQEVRPPGKAATWQVTTGAPQYNQASKIKSAISRSFGVPANKVSESFVSATWGSQISQKALQALIAFLVVIVAYLSLAFEWRMATAALVALAHDLVITVGVYALSGLQVSPATVIGFLTILGYSLYDTVVVFDKVRENTAGLLGTKKSSYSQAANLALNQTLVRSINTSLIALLPVTGILVVATAYLGSGELQDLSLVLFIGMLSGTYSSIFIATPVLADLKERDPQYKALARNVALRGAGGRAAARKGKAPASTGNGGGHGAVALAVAETDTEPDEDAAAGEPGADPLTDERVSAGRAAAGSTAPRQGGVSRPAPRQQPRRAGAAKRRPAGKKKRR